MGATMDMIPAGTRVTASDNGAPFDVHESRTRTYLCKLEIFDQIEQESVDVSIWGSADGQDFGTKPLLKIPQRFYRGETRAVLDLNLRPEVNFIRARWDLFRWGRVAPHPMFVIGLRLEEVPAMAPQRAATPA